MSDRLREAIRQKLGDAIEVPFPQFPRGRRRRPPWRGRRGRDRDAPRGWQRAWRVHDWCISSSRTSAWGSLKRLI